MYLPLGTLCPSKNTDLDELLREIEAMHKTPRNRVMTELLGYETVT